MPQNIFAQNNFIVNYIRMNADHRKEYIFMDGLFCSFYVTFVRCNVNINRNDVKNLGVNSCPFI